MVRIALITVRKLGDQTGQKTTVPNAKDRYPKRIQGRIIVDYKDHIFGSLESLSTEGAPEGVPIGPRGSS